MRNDFLSDDILGDELLGDDIVGDDLGDDIVGDEILGADDIVGDSFVGDDILGDDILGDDLLGDDIGALMRRRRRRSRGRRLVQAQQLRKARNDSMLKKAIAARRLAAGKVVHATGYSKGRTQFISFTSLAVPPGGTAEIAVRPQAMFKGKRLVIGSSIAAFFVIDEFKVGRNSQTLGSGGGSHAEAFKDTATPDDLGLDTCHPGMDLVLKVTNISATSQDFRATLFGDAVE